MLQVTLLMVIQTDFNMRPIGLMEKGLSMVRVK